MYIRLLKLRIIVFVMVLLLTVFPVCFADDNISADAVVNPGDGVLDPAYNVTAFINSGLAFEGREAQASVFAQVDPGSADRMKVTVTLKKISGSSQTTVKTWTDYIEMADEHGEIVFCEYYTVPSSGSYRFTATGTIHRNNLIVDEFDVQSPLVSCS